MAKKPTYEELEQRIKELEKEAIKRKQAEEALKESEERYSTLFDRSLDCVYLHDFEGNFIDANPVALELLGYTKEEILSINFTSLLSKDQIPTAFKVLEEITNTGSQKELTQFKLRHKGGKYVYVETKASLIYRDGKPYAVQGIARDITMRRQTEEELQESEERFRNLVERANEGIVIIQDTLIKYINPRLAEIFSYTVEEVVNTPFTDYLHADKVPELVDRYNLRMAGEDITPLYETVLKNKE